MLTTEKIQHQQVNMWYVSVKEDSGKETELGSFETTEGAERAVEQFKIDNTSVIIQ